VNHTQLYFCLGEYALDSLRKPFKIINTAYSGSFDPTNPEV